MDLLNTKLLLLAFLFICKSESQEDCPDLALEEIPTAYATDIMMNIQFGDGDGDDPVGRTISIYEAADSNQLKSYMTFFEEENMHIHNETLPRMVRETMIWNPEMSGVKNFITTIAAGADGYDGYECFTDAVRDGSILQWLFGWDSDHGFPSIAGMLHMNGQYKPGCPDVIRGIEVNTWIGSLNISEWDTILNVTYYWSDKTKWDSSAGPNKSVPVAAIMEGDAKIPIPGQVERKHLRIEVDYSNFIEIEMPPEFYLPEEADLWCYNREMNDKVPDVPSEISYTEEILLLWLEGDMQPVEVVIPRSVWLDYNRLLTRTDYKPLNTNNNDPFDGKQGFVSQINDFGTGLSYTINMDLGNCSIDYLTNDETGTVIIHDGHIHMHNPFFTMNIDKFAFNGVRYSRDMDVDAYLNNHKPYHAPEGENETNVFFLSSSNTEVQDGEYPERLIPTKVEIYPTRKYNDPFMKYIMNVFHFSKQSPDFSVYDVSPCFEPTEQMHMLVRMGWNEAMDIENTRKLFNDEVRKSVTSWGLVSNLRVVNIEFDIDFTNSALFVVWTILDYPKNVDIDIQDVSNNPDAFRPMDEIKSNIQQAVDKGSFKVNVYTNSNSGQTVVSQAEAGSLRIIGDRSGSYSHKNGYSSGSMAALGIMMLILTVGGILALLVYVLKW